MRLLIQQKTLGQSKPNRSAHLASQSIDLDINAGSISTKELLISLVQRQVADFNAHIQAQRQSQATIESRHGSGSSAPRPTLSTVAIEDYLGSLGKVDFGNSANLQLADPQAALDATLQAFNDGLFVLFIDDEEVTSLEQPLSLYDNCQITFVRLTFLAGGWF